MKRNLRESRWSYKVDIDVARKLANAVEDYDLAGVKYSIIDVYEDIYKNTNLLDEEDRDRYVEEVVDIDDDDEDEIQYMLDLMYDFCDNVGVYIPNDADIAIYDEQHSEEADLDEDIHESEVHVDVDTDEEEKKPEAKDDFRDKGGKEILNEKPLNEDISARPNHDKMLDYIEEGVVFTDSLIRDLLAFMSDDELGEFMHAYGYDEDFYGDYDVKDIDDDKYAETYEILDSLDGFESADLEDDLDEGLDDLLNPAGLLKNIPNPLEDILSEDTIKQNGKWVNKGKEGTHGTFKTKKAADAQRKAMFANGYEESLEEDIDDDLVMPDELTPSFLKTFVGEKPLDECVDVHVNVEDEEATTTTKINGTTTTTTVSTESDGKLKPNDETAISAEYMDIVDADDDIEGLEDFA